MKIFRWGIVGTGSIAERFLHDLRRVPSARPFAVASRSLARAQQFAQAQGIEQAHTLVSLVENPDVDIVYIATPHPQHLEGVLAALEAGKAVLCEKPICLNAGELARMRDCARRNNAFLMEAMWSRFFPALTRAREWVRAGRIGDLRFVQAAFGFRAPFEPASRLLNPALGGGGLLDVGCYVLHLSDFFFDSAPEAVTGVAHIGETGVDEQASLVLRYAGGGIAALQCGVRTQLIDTAVISGTEGRIEIPGFWHAQRIALFTQDAQTPRDTFEAASVGEGFGYEIEHVHACLEKGWLESPEPPIAASERVVAASDALRKQWGLRYPGEA